MKKENPLLMIPGPIQPEKQVMEAMGSPVKAHYGTEWTEIYNQTTATLKNIFNTKGDVFLLVGSGSCAIDACLGSTFNTGDKVILGINGFFGERLKAIAEGYGLVIIPVVADWGSYLKPDDFESAIKSNPDAKGVCVVHLETSTTIINPIKEIGEVVRKSGMCYMVDGVSSIGGIPMEMDAWNIDLCATASQKCLGAPPGLAPVAVSERGWDFINRYPSNGHGWYTNLRTWKKFQVEWGDWHPFPISMATNNVMALKTSLDGLMLEGVETRMERYKLLAMYLRDGLRKIGLKPFTSDEMMAPVLTAAYGIDGDPTSHIVTFLLENHNIKIAGGLGILKDKIIRIGHMAPTVSRQDIDLVLDGLRHYTQNRSGK